MFGITRIKNYWITDFVMKFYGKAYSSRCWNFHLLWRFYLENALMDWAQSLGEYLELMISLRKNILSETIACLVFCRYSLTREKDDFLDSLLWPYIWWLVHSETWNFVCRKISRILYFCKNFSFERSIHQWEPRHNRIFVKLGILDRDGLEEYLKFD